MVRDRLKISLKQTLVIVSTFLGIVVAIVTLMTMADKRYATAESQKQVQQETIMILKQFKKEIASDRQHQQKIYQMQQEHYKIQLFEQRKWNLRDLMRKYPEDHSIREEYNEIKEQLRILKMK